MGLDINSPEFAKQLVGIIDSRVEKKFKELVGTLTSEVVGKVESLGDGTVISVYINNSDTAVGVKNPRSFSLTIGQLVVVKYPNFRNDNSKFIDRVLI